jgi:hypothetical protein
MHRGLPAVAGALVAMAGLAGCTRGKVNDAARYCEALTEQRPAFDSALLTPLDIAPRITVYQQLHDEAPLEVQPDWQAVIDLLNAAANVDLGDQAAVTKVTDQAYSTARAAQSIVDHAARVCGITLPAVGQLPTPGTVISIPEVTTTTAAATPGT